MKKVVRNKGKRKKRRSGLKTIALTVLVLFGVIFYRSVELRKEIQGLERRYSELEEQLREEEERTVLLQERRAYMQTIRYIEEVAREKLGLVYEDEIIFRAEEEE